MSEYISRIIEFIITVILVIFTAWLFQNIYLYFKIEIDPIIILVVIGIFLLIKMETLALDIHKVLTGIEVNTNLSSDEQLNINPTLQSIHDELLELNDKIKETT